MYWPISLNKERPMRDRITDDMLEVILEEMERLDVKFIDMEGKEETMIQQWANDPTPMPAELRNMWLAALRSGTYTQAKEALRRDNGGYCCLGVLCDIKEVTWVKQNNLFGVSIPAMASKPARIETQVLPLAIQEKMNLTYTHQEILAQLNDQGFTFDMIANLLEVVTTNA